MNNWKINIRRILKEKIMLEKNYFAVFILFIVCISTSAKILYKVSGRVIYNGIGQKGIKIRFRSQGV